MTSFWKLLLASSCLLYLSNASHASSWAAGNAQLATVKISNRTGNMWIWVQINENKPIKIWRSEKFLLTLDRANEIYVYKKDPARSAERQVYTLTLGGQGLRELKHGIQVHSNRLVYRYVGKDQILEQKEKIDIWPIAAH